MSDGAAQPAPMNWLKLLLIMLLVARFVLFLRAAQWEPAHLVGDFATDYYPRAEFIAEHGRPPTRAEMATDLYLRPPGTSALLALPIAAGQDWKAVVQSNRVFNLAVETMLLCAMLLFLWRWTGSGWYLTPLSVLLLAQPWTSGFVGLPGADTLNMAFLACSALALPLCTQRLRAGKTPGIAAWVCGLGLAGSLLLRAESILWLSLLALATWWCWWIAPSQRRALTVAFWGPVFVALMICASYSQYVRGSPNLWRADHNEFSENGVNQWVRTWYGTEREKTNIGFYWFRGQHLTMDSVPVHAIRSEEQARRIEAVLKAAHVDRPLSSEAQAELAALARDNRRAAPWDYYFGIPIHHVYQMLAGASTYPEAARLLGRIHPQLGRWLEPVLLLTILAGCILCCVPRLSSYGGQEWRDFRAVALTLIAARAALFAILLKYPENRYFLPLWPMILMLAAMGWRQAAAARNIRALSFSGS